LRCTIEDTTVRPYRLYGLLSLELALSACTSPREPLPITPAGESRDAAVIRRAVPASPAPPVANVAPDIPTLSTPAVVVPAGSIYLCITETGGVRQQTAIEFAPKVGKLCARHPEMSPCQYERNVCRSSGGRVYAAGGVEITAETEAEYDKKVLRVRFKAN
jgi:hypothetical protein